MPSATASGGFRSVKARRPSSRRSVPRLRSVSGRSARATAPSGPSRRAPPAAGAAPRGACRPRGARLGIDVDRVGQLAHGDECRLGAVVPSTSKRVPGTSNVRRAVRDRAVLVTGHGTDSTTSVRPSGCGQAPASASSHREAREALGQALDGRPAIAQPEVPARLIEPVARPDERAMALEEPGVEGVEVDVRRRDGSAGSRPRRRAARST